MSRNKELSMRSRVDGMVRREDIAYLTNHDAVGLELGVASGAFSAKLLSTKRFSQLYSIDMWAGDRGHNIDQYFEAVTILEKYSGRSTILRLRFEEALHLFQNETFDFIYVDGYAHTGQENGQTLRDWWPKLKPGGIFAGDDYSPEWPLVLSQVDKFIEENKLELYVTSFSNVDSDIYSQYPSWLTIKPETSSSATELGRVKYYDKLNKIVNNRHVDIFCAKHKKLNLSKDRVAIRFNDDEEDANIWATAFFSKPSSNLLKTSELIIGTIPFGDLDIPEVGVKNISKYDSEEYSLISQEVEFVDYNEWLDLCKEMPLWPLSGCVVLHMLSQTQVASVTLHDMTFYEGEHASMDILVGGAHNPLRAIEWVQGLIKRDSRFICEPNMDLDEVRMYWVEQQNIVIKKLLLKSIIHNFDAKISGEMLHRIGIYDLLRNHEEKDKIIYLPLPCECKFDTLIDMFPDSRAGRVCVICENTYWRRAPESFSPYPNAIGPAVSIHWQGMNVPQNTQFVSNVYTSNSGSSITLRLKFISNIDYWKFDIIVNAADAPKNIDICVPIKFTDLVISVEPVVPHQGEWYTHPTIARPKLILKEDNQ